MALVYEFLIKALSLFPLDPLAAVIADMENIEVLGYLNYFIPVSKLVTITGFWIGGIVSAKAALFVYHLFLKKV